MKISKMNEFLFLFSLFCNSPVYNSAAAARQKCLVGVKQAGKKKRGFRRRQGYSGQAGGRNFCPPAVRRRRTGNALAVAVQENTT